jgi:hypothetical protein
VGANSNGLTQNARDLAVSGKYVYVLDAAAGLVVYDVSNPTNPLPVYTYASLSNPEQIEIRGQYAFITENTGGGGLVVLDLIDPAKPQLVTNYSDGDFNQPFGLAVQGHYAYVTMFSVDRTVILDITQPTSIQSVRTLLGNGVDGPESVAVSGRYAFVSSGFGTNVAMYDVSNPSQAYFMRNITGITGSGGLLTVANNLLFTTDVSGGKVRVYDLGAAQLTNLRADTAKITNVEVTNDLFVTNQVNAGGGLVVSHGGANITGGVFAAASSVNVVNAFVNSSTYPSETTWGAYINKLLVGPYETTTGTNNFQAVLTYNGATTFGGLCIDDLTNAATCPSTANSSSILTDKGITANAFDLAEKYDLTGTAVPGDLLILDTAKPNTVKQSDGTVYDARLLGVVSQEPGFLLGWTGDVNVALAGRVPLKVTAMNGAITEGDPLTSSPIPGFAMKATHPGMVVGYALDTTSTTSTIDVFVKVGYDARMALGTDASGTITAVKDDVIFASTSTASATNPTVDSWGLTFRGSAWDGSQAVTQDFNLRTDILSATSAKLTVRNASSTDLFTVNQAGSVEITGDLHIGGKLYPSSRGSFQSDKYIFLDDTLGPSSTYMSTNADGWQAESAYDFAERFYSPDALEPGDVVVITLDGQVHVQRSMDQNGMPVGIVSSRPGFVAGAPASSTYPIALSGRVPTNVSTQQGAIQAGDALAPSTIPGVAVKATRPGPVVGFALENYNSPNIGKIQVYVNPTWWGGNASANTDGGSSQGFASNLSGFALVYAGQTSVQVSFSSLGAFPLVQVTPYSDSDGSWWIRNVSDKGFEIVFHAPVTRDVLFAWQAVPAHAGQRMSFSDGTEGDFDWTTGQPVQGSAQTVTPSTSSTDPGSGSSSSTGP